MRVALAGFSHESNTFNPAVTTRAHYEAGRLYRGAGIAEHLAGTDSEMAGFLDGDYEPLPALVAWTWPLGPLTRDCFEGILDELCGAVAATKPFDGCLLSIHGAMVAEGVPDADAVILERVRAVVGSVPLIATFDLHANLHPRMAGLCDALIGYHTYPHVDLRERGEEAARLMARTLRGEVHPTLALSKVPLVPHIMTMLTASGPAAELFKVADRVAAQPGILSTSVALGFAYADVPHLGLTAVAVADGDRDAAQRAADSIAQAAWERRRRFWIDCPSPADAVQQAVRAETGPVVLADIGDNLGGGTPGDGTHLLRLLLDSAATDAVVVLYDPEAVAACQAAGVGADVTVRVGGKQDRLHGDPLKVTGRVNTLSEGIFRNRGPMRDGLLDDQGATAVLQLPCGPLVLTSKRMPSWNLEQLRSCGIEPTRMKIIVCKGALAHRAAYAPIAAEMIDVDTPGVTPADYRRLQYTRVNRPLYRLDEEIEQAPRVAERIDCHTHIGVELAHYLTGAFPYAQHFEGLCRDLDLAGMDRAVVFPMATHLQMGLRALAGQQVVVAPPQQVEIDWDQAAASPVPPPPDTRELRCSFCCKTRTQVRKLVAGPQVYICNECIELCNDILAETENSELSAFPFEFENAHFLTEVYDLFGDLTHRAIPLVIFDPSRQQQEQLEAIEKLAERYPIAGLKLQATMIQAHVTDLPGSGFLELAERHNWPMLIHSAVHPDDSCSQNQDILDVVESRPAVRFNVAHTLRFDRPAIERLAALPNAWFDVSAFCIHCDLAVQGSAVVAPPERRFEADYADPGRALQSYAEAWPERILWGSDTPYYSYVAVFTRTDGTREPYDLRSSMQREIAALRALPPELQDRMTCSNPRAWLYGEG